MANVPLATHNLLQNGDIHDAINIGNQLFWQNRCRSESHGESINAEFNGVNLGPISIVYLSFGAEVSIEPLRNEQHFIVQTTLRGNSRTKNGDREITTRPNDIVVIDGSLPTKITFSRNCAHLVLKIDRAIVNQTLQRLLDQRISEPVLFDLIAKPDNAARKAWFETMNFLCNYYNKPTQQILQNKHLLQSHIDMASCALVSSQKHNYSEQLANDWCSSAPGYIRRACEYIDVHIKELNSVSEVCAVSRVTERSLQNGFKKFVGQSPSAFIQSRRLHHLHQALQTASGDTNVSQIMWEFGINNPGRWARLYLERYGCYPSDTLRKSVH